MSDVKKLAIEIFEGRKEIEKRVGNVDVQTRILEDYYIRDILDIFKISNLSKDSTVLVWQIELWKIKDYDYLIPKISFEKDEYAIFYNYSVLESSTSIMALGDNEELLKKLINLKIPKPLFDDILGYFVRNLLEYFDTVKLTKDCIKIRLNTKLNTTGF